jgi:CelD/BcsL family acetyltransferase involved in cellulose biosynthesis
MLNETSHSAVEIAHKLASNSDWVEPALSASFERFEKLEPGVLWDGWSEIVSQGEFAEPFFQPEWFRAYADSFAADRAKFLLSVWSGERLKGVMPLERTGTFFGGIPARAYRGLSGIHSCRYDLIHDGVNGERVIGAFWRTLASDDWWDVVELEDVPDGGAFERLAQEASSAGYLIGVWPTRRTPILNLPDQGSEAFANCPHSFKSMRSRLKSKLKRLRSEGDVNFKIYSSDWREGFELFLKLENSGWKASSGSAIACNQTTTRFYQSVVGALSERGFLRIYELSVGARPVAMHLGLAMNGVYYAPKVAYDESFARYSPGQLLNSYVIADLHQSGFRLYDFLGPTAEWKMVWASGIRKHSNRYIFRPNTRGRVLHALTMYGASSLRSLYRRVKGDRQAIKLSCIEKRGDER